MGRPGWWGRPSPSGRGVEGLKPGSEVVSAGGKTNGRLVVKDSLCGVSKGGVAGGEGLLELSIERESGKDPLKDVYGGPGLVQLPPDRREVPGDLRIGRRLANAPFQVGDRPSRVPGTEVGRPQIRVDRRPGAV